MPFKCKGCGILQTMTSDDELVSDQTAAADGWMKEEHLSREKKINISWKVGQHVFMFFFSVRNQHFTDKMRGIYMKDGWEVNQI